MRFFLYSYGDAANFKISKNLGVFGCKKRKGGMETKFKNFQKGDIILIRDSSSKKQLKFFGYCKVIGPVLDYDYNKGQFPEFLWEDEKRNKQILYPLRIAVSFSEVPHLSQLHKISWDDILKLNVAINNNQQSAYNYNKIEQLNNRRSYYENAQDISVGMAKTLWN